VDHIVDEQEKPSIAKEIWQMTKAEYESIYGKPQKNSTVTGSFSHHRSAVEIALNRGLEVPEEVLNDYHMLKEPVPPEIK
jgi:hypothetical protein